jgi:hypothetical protein
VTILSRGRTKGNKPHPSPETMLRYKDRQIHLLEIPLDSIVTLVDNDSQVGSLESLLKLYKYDYTIQGLPSISM